ncbi:MAG: YaaA family protein [Prevotella fusca]|uniref:YaaA family protein n=1 Tax=Prevotella fusca TaxID=589436 RepID=UPI003FA0983C
MQILLASAKIMNSATTVHTPDTHLPRFQKEAGQLALELGELSVEDLAKTIPCNEKIALENKLRYQDFFNEEAFIPALLAYYGQAYKCLKAQDFSQEDFRYADKHLWITSFLYGLLRPLDLIHPYRLEGKAKLPSAEGKNMFAYWKPHLTDILIETVKADDGILVHLATEEFQHLFDWKRLLKEVHVIQPLFMVDQGSRLKTVSVYAKSCRGAMTSYILRNQLTSPYNLLGFEYDNFLYHKDYGDESHPHFILKP